jgi:hypothetical protein
MSSWAAATSRRAMTSGIRPRLARLDGVAEPADSSVNDLAASLDKSVGVDHHRRAFNRDVVDEGKQHLPHGPARANEQQQPTLTPCLRVPAVSFTSPA